MNWLLNKFEAEFAGNTVEIKPKNLWMSEFNVLKNNEMCGTLFFNWLGHVIIRLMRRDGDDIDEFTYRSLSHSSAKMGLWENDQDLILTITQGDHPPYEDCYLIKEQTDKFPEHVFDELAIYCGFAIFSGLNSQDLGDVVGGIS